MPNMRVNVSEKIYEMMYESRMLYGAVILGGGSGFCMKVLRNSRNAAKGAAGSEPKRDRRRGKNMRTAHNPVM
jgi:hypothetical protein